jgi:hypothetical protein
MKRYLLRFASFVDGTFNKPPHGTAVTRFQPADDGAAILSAGENASIAYLLQPYLERRGIPFTCVPLASMKDTTEIVCRTVIIARYLPRPWIETLQAFRDIGGKIVYFMDDDLMDPRATTGLPKAYRRKIDALATRQRRTLERLCDEFWVASPHLAAKYADWSPKLLNSAPTGPTLAQHEPVMMCYHGSASHSIEIKWLAGVMRQVQAIQRSTVFEIFGDHEVNKLFRGLPRTSILHPMDWPNYLAYTGSVRRDIGLAPLLPAPFNAGRAPSKFFDFARMGAVGIYTDIEPYRGFVRHGVDGLLLPNDPVVWAATINELAADPARRQRMAAAARERALALASAQL